MAHTSNESAAVLGMALGTLAPTGFAAVCGMVYFLAASQEPVANRLACGAVVGAASMLIASFSLSWHATAVRSAPVRASTAPLWGLVPAILLGGTLGPVCGGTAGYILGALGDGIRVGSLGVFLGPVAWQLAYWAEDLQGIITSTRVRS
ncbi:MAG: hypothetical protein KatS3mg109_0340 [Pirellulaceae bacterium]|nr:MAG: hypothetical protein KatS3mg109_0340 [Pirellulaceae bacterium]GIW96550.1 MAG: hypothetical protein KatS3mg110_4591 [Pirellulaceae bacterium]